MEGADFLAEDYTQAEVCRRSRAIVATTRSSESARLVTPQFKYMRNYLTDRPFMQPSYKDPWPVSKKFREMMANGEMNETQLIFFGPKKEPEELYDLAKRSARDSESGQGSKVQ